MNQPTRQPGDDRSDADLTTWWMVGGIVVVALIVLVAMSRASAGPSSAVERTDRGVSQAAVVPSPRASAGSNVVLVDFEGNPITVAELAGRPLVVNFWASWCAPCLAEMPGFERIYQKYRGSVQFLGINLAEDVEPALAIVERTGVTYPLARDPRGEAFAAFGGVGMPTSIFIDADGLIIEMYPGDLTADELETRIVGYFDL
jgi:thiol-disulfide isomerase/thioredoxin